MRRHGWLQCKLCVSSVLIQALGDTSLTDDSPTNTWPIWWLGLSLSFRRTMAPALCKVGLGLPTHLRSPCRAPPPGPRAPRAFLRPKGIVMTLWVMGLTPSHSSIFGVLGPPQEDTVLHYKETDSRSGPFNV